jgi:hypothetical protein
MYWEDVPGGRRAPYLDLCFETIQRHAGSMEIVVVNRGTAFDWLADLDPGTWERLPTPVYRSDYVRTRLLHQYGGLWLDFDVIATAPLSELIQPVETGPAEVLGWGGEIDRFYNNLFAARPRAPFLEQWIDLQDAVLDRTADWQQLSWAALGQDIVQPLARELDYHCVPIGKIAPVLWYEWRRFLSPFQSPAACLARDPHTVMLWNNVMGPVIGHLDRTTVLAGRCLLSRLLRIALGAATTRDERDARTSLHRASMLRYSRVGRSLAHRLGAARARAQRPVRTAGDRS